MSQEYDREEADGSGAGFFTGLLAGGLIGAGLGLLFAPRKGVELRGQVAESASTVGQAISKTVDDWAGRGRDVYDRARDMATRAGDEVDRVASDAARSVEKNLNAAGDAVSSAARRVEKQAGSVRG